MLDKYRMYGWVPFHLSGIQKGIQFQHAVTDYGQMIGYLEPINGVDYNLITDYKEWAITHKTSIILNGGTTNSDENALPHSRGLQNIKTFLNESGIINKSFQEPDLNNTTTAIVALFKFPYYTKNDDEINQLIEILEGDNETLDRFKHTINQGHSCVTRDLAITVVARLRGVIYVEGLTASITNEEIIEEIEKWYTIRTWLSKFSLA